MANLQFWRSREKSDTSFLDLVKRTFGKTFTTGLEAKTWLTTNGYYTSYPDIVTDGLVLCLDASNSSSFKGEPTTNYYPCLGTIGQGSSSDNDVTFPYQGEGGFIRLGYGQRFGNYTILNTDVVYKFNLGGLGCHYHGDAFAIPSGSYLTFSFDYYISPDATNVIANTLANIENYGGGALSNGIGMSNTTQGIWQSVTQTSGPTSSSGTQAIYLYPGGCGSKIADSGFILYKNVQVELKSYKTPFVNGTRGTTYATGGGWCDLSGNGNHGELISNPLYNSNNLGSLVFNGTNYISNTLAITSSFTISCWFKHNSFSPFPNEAHLICSNDGWGNGRYRLFYSNTAIQFAEYDQGIGFSTTDHLTGWHNILVTYDETTVSLSLDGNIVNSYVSPMSIQTSAMAIGRLYVSPGDIRYYDGNISNVQIYNKALSATEITQNFNATKERFGL